MAVERTEEILIWTLKSMASQKQLSVICVLCKLLLECLKSHNSLLLTESGVLESGSYVAIMCVPQCVPLASALSVEFLELGGWIVVCLSAPCL